VNAPEAPNPYAPPTASLEVDNAPAPAYLDGLASRWQRLGGALFDGLLGFVALVPCFFGLSWSDYVARSQTSHNPFILFTSTGTWGLVAAVLIAALTITQWTLLTKRGQTIGKIVAGTRVVRVDDAPAGFLHAVVLRVLPTEIIGRVGGKILLLQVLLLVDLLFIFSTTKRCLHDRIAGTKVVNVPGR